MRDQAGPSELLILGRRRIEQQARRVVEDGAGVLHAAELKRRHEQEVELAPGIRDGRIAFEPGDCRRVEIENRVAVARDLGGIGLAVEHAERAALPLGSLDRETARGKREEVGRQRLGFGKGQAQPALGFASCRLGAVGDRLPGGRHVQAEGPARLQVGLIEAGERQVRPRGNEERVEELGLSIERRVAGDEVDGDLVAAVLQMLRRNHEMIGDDRRRDRLRADAHAAHALVRHEVQRERTRGILQDERDRHSSVDLSTLFGGDREVQVVTQVADAAGALFSEGERDARGRPGAGIESARWDGCMVEAASAAVASVATIASVPRPRIMPASYQAIFRSRSVASAAMTTKKQRLMNDSRMNS